MHRCNDETNICYVSYSGVARASFGLSSDDLGLTRKAVQKENSHVEAVSGAKVFWSQDGRR